MYVDQESIFYYLTVMNEQYEMPPMPEGARDGILQGAVPLPLDVAAEGEARARSCSAAARSCPRSIKAQEILEAKYDVAPTSGASPATASSTATATRASAGTCCIRARRRACPT